MECPSNTDSVRLGGVQPKMMKNILKLKFLTKKADKARIMSVFSVIFSLLFVPFQSLAQSDQGETYEAPRSPASSDFQVTNTSGAEIGSSTLSSGLTNRMDREKENRVKKRASSPASISAGSELKTSSDTNLQLSQSNTGSRNCPISMPRIRSAIVFQSVEAPQIEPMSQQDQFPYNNYDLVMGKQAGVLVRLGRIEMDRRKEFAIDLTISGENKYRDKCFHEPMKGEMREGQEDFCFFTIGDLRKEGDYKFFPLPMNENLLNKDGITRSVKLTLYPRGYGNNKSCHLE